MAISIQTTLYNLIYVYQIDDDRHKETLKIGKASVEAYDIDELTPNCEALNNAAIARINEETLTAGVEYHLLHTEVAFYVDSKGDRCRFDDHAVHDVLKRSGYKKKEFNLQNGNPNEWYIVDLNTAIKAIEAVKNEQEKIAGPPKSKEPKREIRFREEQEKAIGDTIAHFREGHQFLWNAKMRFGKTLCALELIRREEYGRVLILTHRPAVRSGWFEDYHNLPFKNHQYGSKNGDQFASCDEKDTTGKDFKTLEKDYASDNTHYIYFASMQDLRGSTKVSDKGINKNDDVFNTDWDLIILDEAHEGTETALGKNVIKALCENRNPYMLYLSGTPFNILYHFADNEIYTWDYVMEQDAKENWPKNHPNEPNPYEGLAKLNIYTYFLGDVFETNAYTRTEDDFFNFTEFFRVWTGNEMNDGAPMKEESLKGKFIHENHILKFLDKLCEESSDSKYPYSTEPFRQALSHTLWMLPGIESALALENLIKNHRLCTELHFHTINVAGEGSKIEGLDEDCSKKIEKLGNDALQKVKTAIRVFPRTITLSCGRLTTGVSVPEWTGVFMLRGGYNVDAGNYMQTIFRGQTPFKNGAIKYNCYAFDFAPDRTLTVIDEYIEKQPQNSIGKPQSKGEKTASMLRLCPVIAMKGGKETEYDAHNFIDEVNRAYKEHVIRNGFKGRMLHKSFADFTDADHALLAEIGKIFEGSKVKTTSDGKVKMSDSGLTGEEGSKKRSSKKKDTGKLRLPSTNSKSKEESDRRKKSQNVLDLIFVRLPLLLFGAVEETNHLSIAELIKDEVIDKPSWEVFMPEGFQKPMLLQIAHLVREDLLISCTAEIIKIAKSADELPVEKRVVEIARMLSTFHYPDHETVLTPWRVVNMHMGDTIGGYNFYDEQYRILKAEPRWIDQTDVTERVFRTDAHILEINSKSGVYPLYLTYSLWRVSCEKTHPQTETEQRKIWDEVLQNNMFVLCQTEMAKKITERVLRGYRPVETHCQVYPDLVEILRAKTSPANDKKKENLINKLKSTKYWNINNGNKNMKFNAVVSNPPYQTGVSNDPLYHLFVELSNKIEPEYSSIIMPAKWYDSGKNLDKFRKVMLEDKHISLLVDFENFSECFEGVDIAGGVCYYLRNRNYHGLCKVVSANNGKREENIRDLSESTTFIRHKEAVNIISKLRNNCAEFVSKKVSSQKPFGLRTYVVPTNEGDIILRYNQGKGLFKRELVLNKKEWIDKWKVITSYRTNEHAGQKDRNGQKRVLSTTEVLGPGEVCTETYLVVNTFDTKKEAENFLKYLKTCIVRFLIAMRTSTQTLSKKNFVDVPLLDYSELSSFDWNGSVDDIEGRLYKKYKLEDLEIAFIKKIIKPMY